MKDKILNFITNPDSIYISMQKNRYKKKIINYYKGMEVEPEILEVLEFLKKNNMEYFPYDFSKQYSSKDVEVKRDIISGFKYVIDNGKPLYFPKEFSTNYIKSLYNLLKIEQDKKSPHCYENEKFEVENSDIVLDVGAAEGNFSLKVVEKAKKIYLFEGNKIWIKPLQLTFQNWMSKVEIQHGYVGNEEGFIKLGDVLRSDEKYFVKMDVEGMEESIINGARSEIDRVLNMKIALCTYHNKNDAEKLENIMKQMNFETEFSHGFMVFLAKLNLEAPYLRKVLIRAKKYEVKK